MALTDAQRRAKTKYDQAHYKTMSCKMQIKEAEAVAAHAKKHGETASAYIARAVREQIRRDNGAGPDDVDP